MNSEKFFDSFIKAYLKGDIKVTNKGTYKSCVVYKNRAFLIMDLNGAPVSHEEFLKNRNDYIQRVNKLAETVNTPQILGGKIVDNIYFEMQEQVKGANAWMVQEKEAVKLLNTSEAKENSELPQWQKSQILGRINGYNIAMQIKIKRSEPKDFQKLFKDLKKIFKAGFSLDLLGQNVFYDSKEGFSFIDLDYVGPNQDASDYKVISTAFGIVSNFSKFVSFGSKEQQETIARNNLAIAKRVTSAAKGMSVNDYEWQALKQFTSGFCSATADEKD